MSGCAALDEMVRQENERQARWNAAVDAQPGYRQAYASCYATASAPRKEVQRVCNGTISGDVGAYSTHSTCFDQVVEIPRVRTYIDSLEVANETDACMRYNGFTPVK
jgi:hypothetical protein